MAEQDARLSVKDIASCTGISEGSVQTILKKRLDLRKVCARWVPHLLTEEQKTQHLKCARELLKTYKGCNSRVIYNLLTGDDGCTCLSHKERLIISNGSEKIKKTPMYSTAQVKEPIFFFISRTNFTIRDFPRSGLE